MRASWCSETQPAKWVFLGAFMFSCLLFWWLPTIIFRFLLRVDDPVHDWALMASFVGLLTFTIGYLLPPVHFREFFPTTLLDSCERFAYKGTVIVAIPALLVSGHFAYSRIGVPYGTGELIPSAYQVVLYGHMFIGFLFLGVMKMEKGKGRKIAVAVVLIVLPRLLVSLQGGRFFLAQAVVPITLIGLSRGSLRMSAKRLAQLSALAMFVIFVPALTRGDQIFEQEEIVAFFANGSTLNLFQDNTNLNLADRCPPLLVSLTAKSVPYGLFNACTIDVWGQKGLPATLDRILTYNDPSTENTLNGTGSNYLLELYLTGGLVAIVLGSIIFGYSSRCFVAWIGDRSLFAGIWAECLARALFAPRGNLGYVYERVPSLIFATIVLVAVVYCGTKRLSTAGVVQAHAL